LDRRKKGQRNATPVPLQELGRAVREGKRNKENPGHGVYSGWRVIANTDGAPKLLSPRTQKLRDPGTGKEVEYVFRGPCRGRSWF